jgi:acetyl esterase/lipase
LAFAADNRVALDLLRIAAPAGEPPGPDAHVAYAEVEDQGLGADIWRPAAAAGAAGPEGRAAVVYAHGGAFVAGNLGMRSALFDTLRKAGIVVIDIEYRLTPPPRWQDAPADVLCALVWLRSVAELEGIDPNRVVVMGESAGGSLALLAAYAAGTDRLTASCPGEPIVPAGVVAVAPAADLEGIWQDKTLLVADRPFPEEYVGGPPSEFPARYAAASPFRLIRADLPPTLLLAGENDHLVRLPRVLRIAEALRAAGADVRLLVVPYAEHGFDGLPNGFGSQVELQIVPAFVAEVTG